MGHIESTKVAINPNVLVIRIDVNGLNIRVKRPQLSDGIFFLENRPFIRDRVINNVKTQRG